MASPRTQSGGDADGIEMRPSEQPPNNRPIRTNFLQRRQKRAHPLLPTRQEADANPRVDYSDHLLTNYEITLNPESGQGENFRFGILSLNVCNQGSGVHSWGFEETNEQKAERLIRIAHGLKRTIDTQGNIGVIAIQEIPPEYMINPDVLLGGQENPNVEPLQGILGANWEIVFDSGDPDTQREAQSGIFTCYNRDIFDTYQNASLEQRENRQTLYLAERTTGLRAEIHNVWLRYNAFPLATEEYCREILTAHDNIRNQRTVIDDITTIMVGDFNTCFAPLHYNITKISTDVAPPGFNEEYGATAEQQVEGSPDGCVYSARMATISYDALDRQTTTMNRILEQAHCHTIDLATGQRFESSRLQMLSLASWPNYRMVFTLAGASANVHLINGQTALEYEAWLKAQLEDENILVRMATNSNNERAIGIRLTPNQYVNTRIQNAAERIRGSQTQTLTDDTQVFQCIFVPLKHSDKLHQTITAATDKQIVLDHIDRMVKRLSKVRPWLYSAQHKVAELNELRDAIEAITDTSVNYNNTFTDLINSWLNQEKLFRNLECSLADRNGNYFDQSLTRRALFEMPRSKFVDHDAMHTNSTYDLEHLLEDLDQSNIGYVQRELSRIRDHLRGIQLFKRSAVNKINEIEHMKAEATATENNLSALDAIISDYDNDNAKSHADESKTVPQVLGESRFFSHKKGNTRTLTELGRLAQTIRDSMNIAR